MIPLLSPRVLRGLAAALCASVSVLAVAVLAPSALAQPAGALPNVSMPPADRAWTADDFSAAALALRIRQNALPAATEADFAPRFSKLTSAATLREADQPDAAIAQRVGNAYKMLLALRGAFVLYADAGPQYMPEVVRLLGMLLDTAAFTAPLADELLAGVPRDASYATRAAGMAQMRLGMGQMALAAAVMIGEQKGAEQQIQLAQALTRTLPVLKTAMPPDMLTALRAQLARPVTLHSDDARTWLQQAVAAAG